MNNHFLSFNSMSQEIENKIKENLKFKTGKFVWRIKFNTALNPQTVNNQNCYVINAKKVPLKTIISYNTITNEIEIEPIEAYSQTEIYILHISTNVKSVKGKSLKSPIDISFNFKH